MFEAETAPESTVKIISEKPEKDKGVRSILIDDSMKNSVTRPCHTNNTTSTRKEKERQIKTRNFFIDLDSLEFLISQ
jgi:hypothetical protein